MRRIVLDAQYSVMTSALTMALKHGRPDFQVQNAGPKTKDIVSYAAPAGRMSCCWRSARIRRAPCRTDCCWQTTCGMSARTAKRYCLWMRPNIPNWPPPCAWQKRITLSMISSTLPSRLPI